MFEYHTFLHHSQTFVQTNATHFSFEYHTFLHHSQTYYEQLYRSISLSTIHFYIILKLNGSFA